MIYAAVWVAAVATSQIFYVQENDYSNCDIQSRMHTVIIERFPKAINSSVKISPD